MINKVYQENFEKCFVQQYSMIALKQTSLMVNVNFVIKIFVLLVGKSVMLYVIDMEKNLVWSEIWYDWMLILFGL